MAKSRKVKTKGPEAPQALWTIGVKTEKDSWYNDDGEDSSEPYSYRGSTTARWDVQGLHLMPSGDHNYGFGYREFCDVGFLPEVGKTYHLLFCIYSTGDTFGHDEQACFEAIGVYEDKAVAYENEQRLRTGHPLVKGQYGSQCVLLKLEGTEKQVPYNRPWDGYFESLDRLEVMSFELEKYVK